MFAPKGIVIVMRAATIRTASSKEGGFTLVEILTCLVVIAIAGLAMTAFFVHALSYAKGNQNKTVMINLARNTLFYMQKQSKFDDMKTYFKSGQQLGIDEKRNVIDSDGCPSGSRSCTDYANLVADAGTLVYVLNPEINGVSYHVTISYQDKLHSDLDDLDSATASAGTTNSRISGYLLPIKVEVEEVVKDDNGNRVQASKRKSTEVEGYISDETIR